MHIWGTRFAQLDVPEIAAGAEQVAMKRAAMFIALVALQVLAAAPHADLLADNRSI